MGLWDNILTGLEYLDKPSNALQGLATEGSLEGLLKGWDQQKNYDFEEALGGTNTPWGDREGILDHASYLGSGVLNMLLDPANLVGAGMFTKGTKGIKEAVENLPNALPGFYQNAPAALARAMPQTLSNTLRGALDPRAIARRRELGINPTTGKILDNPTAYSPQALHGEIASKANFARQFGEPTLFSKAADFALGVTEGTLDSNTLRNAINKSSNPYAYKPRIAQETLEEGLDMIKKSWDVPEGTNVLFKPLSKEGYNISRDVATKAINSKAVQNLFENKYSGFQNNKKLSEALKKQGIPFTKGDDGSVWLNDSFRSSSYTEGGVNARTLVRPNGDLLTFVTDEHDLFGKVAPGMKRQLTVFPPYVRNPIRIEAGGSLIKAAKNKSTGPGIRKIAEKLSDLPYNVTAKDVGESLTRGTGLGLMATPQGNDNGR